MSLVLEDRVCETWSGTGTGPLSLGGAYPDHRRFRQVMHIGDTTWVTIYNPGAGQWVTAIATYTALDQLTISTIKRSTSSTVSPDSAGSVTFGAGVKLVFIDLLASMIGLFGNGLLQLNSSGVMPVVDGSNVTYATRTNVQNAAFPTGTKAIFNQTAAPTSWTKDTTHNDKALRIVSGPASSGGSSAFSTVFGKTATDNLTLTNAHLPSTTLNFNGTLISIGALNSGASNTLQASGLSAAATTGGTAQNNYGQPYQPTVTIPDFTPAGSIDAFGSSSPHAHAIDLRVQYVDSIIATKD